MTDQNLQKTSFSLFEITRTVALSVLASCALGGIGVNPQSQNTLNSPSTINQQTKS